MKAGPTKVPRRGPLIAGLLSFVIAALVTAAWAVRSEQRRAEFYRAEVAVRALDKAQDVSASVEHALAATYALAALLRQGRGAIADFAAVAHTLLPYFPGVSALQLAPQGVIRDVVPLAGNEPVIGYDLLADPARNAEAFAARDSGRLTLAGPFELIQGGIGAVGRLPVYLPDDVGELRFWGFVTALLRFPEVLGAAHLERLEGEGFRYQLWRPDPAGGGRQVLATGAAGAPRDPTDHVLELPNGSWTLSVAPAAGWHDDGRLALKLLLALAASLLLGLLARELVAARLRLQAAVSAREAELGRAQAAAHATADQLRKLSTAVEHCPAAIVITDPEGAIEYVNPRFEQSSGYGRDEVLGQNPRVLKSGKRSAEEYAELWRTITGGGVWRGEFENVRKDGSHYWEMAAIAPIRGADGGIAGYVAVKEDITVVKQAERERRVREAKLAALIGSLPDAMFVIDRARRIVEFHAPRPDRLWRSPDQFLHRPYVETLPAEIATELDRALCTVERGGEPCQIEYSLTLAGGVRHFNASINALGAGEDADGEGEVPAGYIVLARDVTRHKRMEERMREALVVFNASSQGIMTTDADGVITSVNPAFCAITGFSAEEVIGEKSSIFKSGRHEPVFYREMWQRLTGEGAWEGEIWNRRKNGETYPQWLTITAVRDDGGRVSEYVSLFSDITERKRQEQAIWQQANFDPLTGLANRSLLQDRLERALAHARRHGDKVGLLFIDLDGFKWINDSLGHDVGDELLIEVAARLLACVREQDTVARLGGDEFTIVIGELEDSDVLRAIAEKLVHALREPFALGSARHHVSGSIGITVFPEDGADVQTLLRNADIAMYQAKQAGKNRARFYAHHMQADALARMQLEAELRVAIECSQFALYYQPVVAAGSGRLVGAEALIRWCHPERGTIAPGEFIPVAEDSALIVPIGAWALGEALRQGRRWRDAGYPALRIAVNVSGVQFREPGLPELVDRLLAESGATREHLMLEITESVLMDSSDEAEARIHRLKAQGIGYALDDFGTGFSSLSYLKRFPVDGVKIDRSFVRDCPHDRSDASLVEAIINMAHSLGLRVTAEGVETDEQLEFLRALGCDFIQGFLVARPLPADEFVQKMGPLWSLDRPDESMLLQ